MICRFKVENYKAFADEVEILFYADMTIKRFEFNYLNIEQKNILKVAGFYGPNNTGKTCILSALNDLSLVMLNKPHGNLINVFAKKGSITSFSVEYVVDGRFYEYEVKYDNQNKKYIYERLIKKVYSDTNHSLYSSTQIAKRENNTLSFLNINNYFRHMGGEMISKFFSLDFPIMLLMGNIPEKEIVEAVNDYKTFANSFVFLKMDDNIDLTKTISLLNNNEKARAFIVEFVKNCDLNIEDFGSNDTVMSDVNIEESLETALKNPLFQKDTLKVFSVHNGFVVPSVFFDSVGTQKIVALSGYLYEAIHDGKILLIDEIDSSLHHIITRSLVALFNNMLNTKAQLLFTTQDALLLDLQKLLRKDQVWFLDVADKCSSKLVHMSERFSSREEDGIRGDEYVVRYYLKGRFGSIPTPDLFSSLEIAASED